MIYLISIFPPAPPILPPLTPIRNEKKLKNG